MSPSTRNNPTGANGGNRGDECIAPARRVIASLEPLTGAPTFSSAFDLRKELMLRCYRHPWAVECVKPAASRRSVRFMVPTRVSVVVETTHEPPNHRQVLECGGWRGTGLTPLLQPGGPPHPKRCVPPPLTHRTPRRYRGGDDLFRRYGGQSANLVLETSLSIASCSTVSLP